MKTNFYRSLLFALLLIAGAAHAQSMTDNGFVTEAPVEYRNGVLYSNFIKAQFTNNNVIAPPSSQSLATNDGGIILGTSNINSGALRAVIERFVTDAGGDPASVVFEKDKSDTVPAFKIHFPVMVNIDGLKQLMRQDNADVRYVCPPYSIKYLGGLSINDPGGPANPFPNWHLKKIQAPAAWAIMQGQGINDPTTGMIAVIDNGLADLTNPDLSGGAVTTPSVTVTPTTACTSLVGDHSTAVCSIIAGTPNNNFASAGVVGSFLKVQSYGNPVPPKDLCNRPASVNCPDFNSICGSILNSSNRPKVLSISFVFADDRGFQSYDDIKMNVDNLEKLIANGVVVVSGVGNEMAKPVYDASGNPVNTVGDANTALLRGIGYPFGLPGVIGVGATAPDYTANPLFEYGMASGNNSVNSKNGTTSGGAFNYNYHNTANPYDGKNKYYSQTDINNEAAGYLDIVAPGKNIDVAATQCNSTQPSFQEGTSMATPIVASVAAAVKAMNTALTNTQISEILFNTADKVEYHPNGLERYDLNGNVSYSKGYKYYDTDNGLINPDVDLVMGHGRVNMLSAVMTAPVYFGGTATFTPTAAVSIDNTNDHSYLKMPYNESYEYDALLVQKSHTSGTDGLHFSGSNLFTINQEATFRQRNANLYLSKYSMDGSQTNNNVTKHILENGSKLEINTGFDLQNNSLIEVDAGATLVLNGATVQISKGGMLQVKNGGTLILNNSNLIVNNFGYLCIEPNATIINNTSGVSLQDDYLLIGLNPTLNMPNDGSAALPPCKIIASPSYINNGGNFYYKNLCLTLAQGTQVNGTSCGNDGSIDVKVVGTFPNSTFHWSNNKTTSSISGLSPGIYTVTITNGAEVITPSFEVIQRFPPLPTLVTVANVNCINDATGGINITSIQYGTPPFTYKWSDGQTTQNAVNLTTGNYTVTVTDANGCARTASSSVSYPYNPLTITPNNITFTSSCYNDDAGVAEVNISGGYVLDKTGYDVRFFKSDGTYIQGGGYEGATLWKLANVPAGSYYVIARDLNSCTTTASFTIIPPHPSLSFVSSTIVPTSNCQTNGSVTVSMTGGVAPYTYLWNTNTIAASNTNLAMGSYSVTVTDANGCQTQNTYEVTGTGTATFTLSTSQSNICLGVGIPGSASVAVSGSYTPSLTYQWSANTGGATTSGVGNLPAGKYYVQVTDGAGLCAVTSVDITENTTRPTAAYSIQANCGQDYTIFFNCSGGSGAPYHFNRNPNGMPAYPSATIVTDYASVIAMRVQAVVTPSLFNIGIIDQNSCEGDILYQITVPNIVPQMQVSTSATYAMGCTGPVGSAEVSLVLHGYAPYNYQWSSGENGTTASIITGKAPGLYSVTVTDVNGCTASDALVIANNQGVVFNIDKTDESCAKNDGTATVVIIGGTANCSYVWSTGATTATISGLGSGRYTVTVTPPTGSGLCTNVGDVIIDPKTPFAIVPTVTQATCISLGTIYLVGTGPDQNGFTNYVWNTGYVWSSGSTNTVTYTGLVGGVYSATVTDFTGCTRESGPIFVPQASLAFKNPTPTVVLPCGTPSVYIGVDVNTSFSSVTPSITIVHWTDDGSTTNPRFVGQGSYTVIVSDGASCTASQTITVVSPNPLSTQVVTSTTTNTSPDPCKFIGQALVNIISGNGSYKYQWSTGETDSHITDLGNGNYNVTITDAAGCSVVDNFNINNNSSFGAALTYNVSGACVENLSASTTAGGIYSYVWSKDGTVIPSQNGSSLPVTGPGLYEVTVTSNTPNSCSAQANYLVPASAIFIQNNGFAIFCNGDNADFSINGNPTPNLISYNWTAHMNPPVTATTATFNFTVAYTGTTASFIPVTVSATEQTTSCVFTATYNMQVLPPANFTVQSSITGTTVPVNTPVDVCNKSTFTLTGSAGYTYSWLTPQGTTVNGPSITISPKTAGTVTYTVMVSGSNYCPTSRDIVVNVHDVSIAVASNPSAQVCSGAPVSVTSTVTLGSGSYSYQWSTGKTTASFTDFPTTASASVIVNYSVTVTDNVTGCAITNSTGQLTVYPQPTSTITAGGPTTFCAGGSVVLFASTGSGYTYHWNTTPATTPTITASVTNTYAVTVTGAGGCSASASIPVVVHPAPTLTITPSGTTSFCPGRNVRLVATSNGTGSYAWSPASGLTNSNISNPFASPTATTTYTVTFTDNSFSCATTASVVVTIYATPTANITPSTTTTFCAGGSVVLTACCGSSYLWANNSATTQAITAFATSTYVVVVSNANTCTASASIPVDAVPVTPGITASGPTTFCQGGSVTITADNSSAYLWSNSATTQSITVTTAGNYSVTTTNSLGCTGSSFKMSVGVNPLPVATIASPTTICAGSTGVLTVNAASGYIWSTSATTRSININTSGTYAVTITDGNGCKGSTSATVITNPTPTVNAGADVILCGTSAQFHPTHGFNNYSWTPIGSLSSSNFETPVATPTITTTYTLVVTDANGCTASDDIVVIVPTTPPAITGTVTWGSSMLIKGNVIVPQGAALIINGGAVISFMDANSGIIVQPGGSLTITTATVTNGYCGNAWAGIALKAAIAPNGGSLIATLVLNNATISYGTTAINSTLDNSIPFNLPPGVIPLGAHNSITATNNTQFINNGEALHAAENVPTLVFQANPDFKFTDTYFITNDNMIGAATNITYVNLIGNVNSAYTTCHFLNQQVSGTKTIKGVNSLNSLALNFTGNEFASLNQGMVVGRSGNMVTTQQFYNRSAYTGNTFDKVPFGMNMIGSYHDQIGGHNPGDGNNFTNIPNGTVTGTHTYGVYMVGCNGFNMEGNNFAGTGGTSATPTMAGSHAMILDASSVVTATVFNNYMVQTDYGVQTQNDNTSLKIRCNHFAADGVPHFANAWYTINGTLRTQGNGNLCIGNPAEAAGNDWATNVNTTSCTSIVTDRDIYVGTVTVGGNPQPVNFNYWANTLDKNGFSSTIPRCNSAAWVAAGKMHSGCAAADPSGTSCVSATPGIIGLPSGGPIGNCDVYIKQLQATIIQTLGQQQVLQATIDALTRTLGLGGLLTGGNPTGGGNSQLAQLSQQADELGKTAIELTDQIVRTANVCPLLVNVKQVLSNSTLIPAQKDLVGLLMQQGDFAGVSSTLAKITTMNNALVWNDPVEKAYQLADNVQFVNYMTILNNAIQQGRSIVNPGNSPITQLTQGEIAQVRAVANAGTQTSAQAQVLLTMITGETFTHSILKAPVTHGARNGAFGDSDTPSAGDEASQRVFKLYPNPNDGNMTLEYQLKKEETGELCIFDITGRLISKYKLAVETSKININESHLQGGTYFYQVKVNGNVAATEKLVIISQ